MRVYSKIVEVKTYGPLVVHPITQVISGALAESGITSGIVWASVEGATPALFVLRRGLEQKFVNYITRLIPITVWRHDNAYAHLMSTIISTNFCIPVVAGKLALHPDEEVYLLETRSVYNHSRRVFIEIHGH